MTPIELAIEALESCTDGDYSTGHVINPHFDRAMVDAAIAALRTQPAGWMPIESAPKDAKILLWGRYWNNTDVFQHPMIGMWDTHHNRWVCNFNAWFGVNPTHWMPLPTAPLYTPEQSK